MQWMPPEDPAPGHEPVSGDWQFLYRYDYEFVHGGVRNVSDTIYARKHFWIVEAARFGDGPEI